MNTPDTTTTEGKIAVMQAHAEGRKIEFAYKLRHKLETGGWNACENPAWDWLGCDYRIKPEPPKPKLRPWTPEEAVGKAVRKSFWTRGVISLITHVEPGLFRVGAEWTPTPEAMLAEWQQADGSPCGVEVTE